MKELFKIDEVRLNDPDNFSHSFDILELDWAEAQKNNIEMETKQGKRLLLVGKEGYIWKHNSLLYTEGTCIAQLQIKPSLCITFESDEMSVVADFTYYIGNRHMPLFTDQAKNRYWLVYDEKIFNQLKDKYQEKISTEDIVLNDEKLIRYVYQTT